LGAPVTVSTSEKLDWLDAVMADERLDARAKVVAYGIAMHLNRTRGDAFVSDRTIADKTGCRSVRTVQGGRRDLQSCGWIVWKRTGTANIYSMLKGQMEVVVKRQKILKTARESARKKMRRPLPISDAQTSAYLDEVDRQTSADLDSQHPADLDAQTSADIPVSYNPVALTPVKKEKSLATKVSSEFEVWWARFPRKVAKLQALKIYTRIVESCQATSAELLAGAEQYAAERRGQDPKFTKHAATWLNQGCWHDEAPHHQQTPTAVKPTSRADSAIDGMRGYAEDRTP
jgi:hypothetical protein